MAAKGRRGGWPRDGVDDGVIYPGPGIFKYKLCIKLFRPYPVLVTSKLLSTQGAHGYSY